MSFVFAISLTSLYFISNYFIHSSQSNSGLAGIVYWTNIILLFYLPIYGLKSIEKNKKK